MANRALTVAELKAMLENLADKVTEEGADLYQDISIKMEELSSASAVKANQLITELAPQLERLKETVSEEGKEIIALIQGKADDLMEEVQGEIAEFKEVGFSAWIESNPMTAIGIFAVFIGVVIAIVMAVK